MHIKAAWEVMMGIDLKLIDHHSQQSQLKVIGKN